MDFTTLDLPGAPLREGTVWIYYDGPMCFTLETTPGDTVYIVNAVDETDNGDAMRFLAAPQSLDQLRLISEGALPFRDAFTAPIEGLLYLITWQWEAGDWAAVVEQIMATSVPEAWLPLPAARLRGVKTAPGD